MHRHGAFASEFGPERLAIHEGHYVVEEPVQFAGVVKWQNVRMRQLGHDADLAWESVGPQRGSEFGTEHFYGDRSVVLDVARQIDCCHAAGPEFALELVVIGKGCPNVVPVISHGA